ncbi:MAG: hypothetical protein KY475_08430, partial [Planctomycetes bacterium]|nr:hypothetical protein [Planctomycetota bacterium]
PLEALDFLAPPSTGQVTPKFEVSASLTNLETGPDFRFDATYRDAVRSSSFRANNHGAAIEGQTNFLGQQTRMRGTISDNGVLTLSGGARATSDSDVFVLKNVEFGLAFDFFASASLSQSNAQIQLSVVLDVWAHAFNDDRSWGIGGNLHIDANAILRVGQGPLGRLNANVDAQLVVVTPLFDADINGSIGLRIDDNELAFEIAGETIVVPF